MAGGRDILRDTLRIRREQRERNRKAQAEKEERLTKMEQGTRPSDLRKNRVVKDSSLVRLGHRTYSQEEYDALTAPPEPKGEEQATTDETPEKEGAEEGKMERAPVEDKMDRGEQAEDKGALTVAFASTRAEQLARQAMLRDGDFTKVKPSGATGYTAADVRGVIG